MLIELRPAPSDGVGIRRLQDLKKKSRRPGEASFFWLEPQFGGIAVKVLPGEYYVDDKEIFIMTTLGSCIGVCLWDKDAQIGGLNHFMLPDGAGTDARYGVYAMEVLIREIINLGALRRNLEAKIFGGAQLIGGEQTLAVGERNTKFVMHYLNKERIPVRAKDVLDIYPRKLCFCPTNGAAFVKRLASTNRQALLTEKQAMTKRLALGAPRIEAGDVK